MTLNSKLLITRYRNGILTALLEEGKAIEIDYEKEAEEEILGNIYIGRVQNVVKNMNAAFIAYQKNKIGYFSFQENTKPIFLNKKNNPAVCEGDLLLVQISTENIKTKAPVLTSKLSIPGKYCVLTVGNTSLSISGKIRDGSWRKNIIEKAQSYCTDLYGFIIRTNAYQASIEEIQQELSYLSSRMEAILRESPFRNSCTLIYQTPPAYLANIRDVYTENLEKIITDQPDLYETMKDYLKNWNSDEYEKLELYKDPLLSLSALYSLEIQIERALKEKVWLKSGGYLVIQPTEALVVIDVNTGKFTGKKTQEEAIFYINLEAAEEIAKQLRLRNLSGIIIVDFINMESKDYQKQLLEVLNSRIRRDPVKTVLIGMTKLNLVEMTRKKIKKPFYEQIAGK